MATPPPFDLRTVLSESKRIINAHSRHFLALSVLFLLPLSFSFSVYPTVDQLTRLSTTRNVETHLRSVRRFRREPIIPTNSLVLGLVYALFVFIFSLLAVGSVTYSVYHGFYGRPVKLGSAIKSAFASFLPLLSTSVFQGIIILGIFLISGVFLFSVVKVIELLGLHVDFSSPYFITFCGVLATVLLVFLIYLQVNWSLVNVVVAVESSWGLQPLKRSQNLIEGMRRVALSLLLVLGFFTGILVWGSTMSAQGLGGNGEKWKSWAFVCNIVITTTFLMLTMLYNLAATTVLYMYCKAIHGELAGDIAEEFAREYVCLPFDEGKVPHLVSIAYG